MKKMIDISLLICVLIMLIIGILYFFIDTILSFGIMTTSIDIRIPLIIIEYVLFGVVLVLIIIRSLVEKWDITAKIKECNCPQRRLHFLALLITVKKAC